MTQRSLWLSLLVVTALSAWLTATQLRVSSDLTALFPDGAEATALGRYARAFGGGDLALILLRGADPTAVTDASRAVIDALQHKPSVEWVIDRAPDLSTLDPTLAWVNAGPSARLALARALTPEGMRQRLDGTRDLLLAPGASGVETWLARDPLRLALVPWEGHRELAAGVTPSSDGSFVTADGRARLVLAEPRGRAFDPGAAAAFVHDARDAFRETEARIENVDLELTGGHAIAQATQALLVRDLAFSGTLSLLLASIVFVAAFRRARALLAVLPPLVLGTLWTTGIAALAPGGLTAIAIAFTAVVVGVGVDTGVHVYAALLEARRQGLAPAAAAAAARESTARPTLLAAGAAALAFGSLALSGLRAMRQLGVLCAVGEVLTALAILVVTPSLGARLERGEPPPRSEPRWLRVIERATATRMRAGIGLACALVPALLLGAVGLPRGGDAVVAIRPHALPPLAVQESVYELFGGRPGQWVALSIDSDRVRAATRADAIAEAVEPLAKAGTIDGYDALATYAPAPNTQRLRLAARDALDLPALRPRFEDALVDRGFDKAACVPALEAFAHPSNDLRPLPGPGEGPLAWIVARHLAQDEGQTLAATYVRPRGDPAADARALAAIHSADPETIVTGYPYLEAALRSALSRDLPRVALVALILVGLALRTMLGRTGDVALAMLTLVTEVSLVLLAMRALHLHWHVYDALVLPVLVGVTIDESVFLLHAARRRAEAGGDAIARALVEQGPLVTSTALTTATGFGALLACRFEGLFDLGAVGAIGTLAGLFAALVVVPAGLRLSDRGRP